jgi:DNA-binding Xre family transcriptional regulator
VKLQKILAARLAKENELRKVLGMALNALNNLDKAGKYAILRRLMTAKVEDPS